MRLHHRQMAVLLTVVMSTVTTPNWGHAPRRSVKMTAWAIGVANHGLSLETRSTYAKILIKIAKLHDFDPLTGVALVWHESRWNPSRTGDHGVAIGLGQIQYTWLCKKDPSRCPAVRARLFEPSYNLTVMGQLIASARSWCRRQTGRTPHLSRWLHAYGFNQRKNLKCNMVKRKGRWIDRPDPTEIRSIKRFRQLLLRGPRSSKRNKRQ